VSLVHLIPQNTVEQPRSPPDPHPLPLSLIISPHLQLLPPSRETLLQLLPPVGPRRGTRHGVDARRRLPSSARRGMAATPEQRTAGRGCMPANPEQLTAGHGGPPSASSRWMHGGAWRLSLGLLPAAHGGAWRSTVGLLWRRVEPVLCPPSASSGGAHRRVEPTVGLLWRRTAAAHGGSAPARGARRRPPLARWRLPSRRRRCRRSSLNHLGTRLLFSVLFRGMCAKVWTSLLFQALEPISTDTA
jgi:hypothetical protein